MKKINTIPYKKQNKIIYTNIKTATGRTSTKNNKEKNYSKIFNYEGLNTAIFKYNLCKSERKNLNNEVPPSPVKNLEKITIENSGFDNISNFNEDENIKCFSKLKVMNSNMDLILTDLKDNLENEICPKEKKLINYDIFIQQIDSNRQKNTTENNNNSNDKENNISNNSLNGYFSELSITHFNFEIINRKKYFLDVNKLDDEEKKKLIYIFGNNLNNILDLDEIIDYMYEEKNKFEQLKKSNKLFLEKNEINEKFFKEIVTRNIELNKIENQNEILRKEINILIEALTNSHYIGNELLNRYYNKLNKINNKIQNNIVQIEND